MTTFAGLTRSLWLRDARAVAQPPQFSPSLLDRVYRMPSIFLSLALARLGATPNGITIGWIAIGLAGVLALSSGNWWVRVGGALLLQLSYLLDFVDGEVARLRSQSSPVGAFLDLLGHGLIKTSLPLAAAWTAAHDTNRGLWMIAGAAGAVSIGVGDALRFHAAVVGGDLASGDLAREGRTPRGPRRSPPWRRARKIATGLFNLSFESPGLYGLALVGALLDRLDVVAAAWAAGGVVWFVRRAVDFSARLRPGPPNGAGHLPRPDGTDCR